MDKFWELLKESTITQSVITVGLLGISCYLWATGQQVPEVLLNLDMIVVSFFFGSKMGMAQGKASKV